MKNAEREIGIIGKLFVAMGLITPMERQEEIEESRKEMEYLRYGYVRKRSSFMDLILPTENGTEHMETQENAALNKNAKINKRNMGILGRLLIALGLIEPLEDAGRITEINRGGCAYNSYEEFCAEYNSVDLVMYEKQEYAFCELKSDQITRPQILSEILRVVNENGKIWIEPVGDEIKPKLLEARIIKQINALR